MQPMWILFAEEFPGIDRAPRSKDQMVLMGYSFRFTFFTPQGPQEPVPDRFASTNHN